ncbi:uncharacterized protein PV09_08364 [Verruconis gallopava]|uniref:ATPase AAA-type core domain-containing protein n=1 Tax=Verruconis gallopava TaxID=253628 RepID=A0A0D1YGV9_9PEZI|nr:uncharacterized protein PV09_08364 [Verruconis gallopava]KIW00012.1 hypothetical protein PV09_08364 [Verruconis gallopava]
MSSKDNENAQTFDDFVPGKVKRNKNEQEGRDVEMPFAGRALIIRLCGPPGVGKTLTAEATFLRLLEYYPGVLILNKNRISAIDLAFGSCIDVVLAYGGLGVEERAQV